MCLPIAPPLSLHLTMMCLQYKPRVVACLCIHLACKWSNWEIPKSSENKDWFWYVDQSCTAELLEELTSEFLAILDKCPSRLKRKIMSIGAGSSGSSSSAATTPVASAPSSSGTSSRKEAHGQQRREERSAAAASHEPSTSSEAPVSSERQPASSSHGGSRKPPSDPTQHRNAKVPPHHGPAQRSPGLAQLQIGNQGAEHMLSPGKRKALEGTSSHSSQPLSLDAYRDKRCRQKGQPKPHPPPSDRSESHHGVASHPPHQAPSSHSQSRHHQQPHLEPTSDVGVTTAPPHHPSTASTSDSSKPPAAQVKPEQALDDASGFNFNFGAQFGGDGGDSSIDSFSFGLDGPDIMPAISPLQFDTDERSNSQDVLMTLSQVVPPPPSVPMLPAEENNVPPKMASVPPVAVPPAKAEPRTPPLPPTKARPSSPPQPQKPVPANPPLPPQKSQPSTPPIPPPAVQLPPPPPLPAALVPTAAPLPAPVADKPEIKAEVKQETVVAPPVKDKEKERSERKERKERHKHKHSSSERSRNKHSSPGKHSGGEKTSEGKSHGDRVPEVGAHHAVNNAVDVQQVVNHVVDGTPVADSDRKLERNGISKHDRKSSGSSKSETLKIKIPKLKIVPPTPTPPPVDPLESGKGPHTPPPPSTGLKLKISKERLNSGRKRDRRSEDGEHRARSPKSRKVSAPVPPPPPPPPGPSYPGTAGAALWWKCQSRAATVSPGLCSCTAVFGPTSASSSANVLSATLWLSTAAPLCTWRQVLIRCPSTSASRPPPPPVDPPLPKELPPPTPLRPLRSERASRIGFSNV
ncbi:hypothetical protein MRX96_050689 [Rhipicephalus microplus]